MLTWAIAWMAVQMVRAGKELDSLDGLVCISILADAFLLGLGGWAIAAQIFG